MSKRASDDAFELYALGMMGASTNDVIPMQERRGQQEQARSETLPKDGPREQMEALGFVFGADVDELFVAVQFPDGWKKVPTDHNLHTDLVDGQGRKRGSIFYKAAFYDRRADYHLITRYGIRQHYGQDATAPNDFGSRWRVLSVQDRATGATLWIGDPIQRPEFGIGTQEEFRRFSDLERDCWDAAKAWIAEHYPDCDNPVAYWDEKRAEGQARP